MSGQTGHQFAGASDVQNTRLRSDDYELEIKQGPKLARVAVGKEKDRKPVDPPPIIQLKIKREQDPGQNYLQSPYYFMSCSLVAGESGGAPQGTLGTALAGTLVSSLHRLKDTDNKDGAFFVWGDLSVKIEGTFRLQFNLYEMRDIDCYHLASIESDTFPVYSAKSFPGMAESTFITRAFSDQGVRLRLRKEPRALLRKRGPAHDDYEPRHYRSTNRQPSQREDQQTLSTSEPQSAVGQNEQGEVADGNQIQSYEQTHPQMNRHYSQQSSASWVSGSVSYDEPSKRPRTGSSQNQSPNLGPQHNQSLASPQYPPQQSFNAYLQQTQQQPGFGYAYPQSPQTNTPTRDSYPYSTRIGTSQNNTSSYGQLKSPTDPFPPTQGLRISVPQPQQGAYGASQMMGPSPTTRVEGAFGDMGFSSRPQISPRVGRMGMPSMAPPTFGGIGGMTPSPVYGNLSGGGLGRIEPFQAFTGSTQSLPVTTMAGFLGSRGPTINSTTAPGSLGSTY